ncbi:hypothetical protein D3C77_506160 [compost metagenome]
MAVDSADGLFARQFAASVDTQRVGLVVFVVGAVLTSVEHVVGGVVDQWDTQFRGFLGEDARCSRIDRESQLRLAFSLIDCCMSRSVDDQVWLECLYPFTNSFRPGQVELLTAQNVQLAEVAQAQLQFTGHLAVLATDQDGGSTCSHGSSSSSFSDLPT